MARPPALSVSSVVKELELRRNERKYGRIKPFIPVRSIQPLIICKRLASAERLGHGRLGDTEQSCNGDCLVHMDKTAAIESVRKYAERVRRDFNVKKVILFGSYANGTAREDSDIDVAVVFESIDGDYLDVITRLTRIRRDVEHRIEPVVLEELNDQSGFLKEITKSGVIIYAREKPIIDA